VAVVSFLVDAILSFFAAGIASFHELSCLKTRNKIFGKSFQTLALIVSNDGCSAQFCLLDIALPHFSFLLPTVKIFTTQQETTPQVRTSDNVCLQLASQCLAMIAAAEGREEIELKEKDCY
jgi:hypothetical protein